MAFYRMNEDNNHRLLPPIDKCTCGCCHGRGAAIGTATAFSPCATAEQKRHALRPHFIIDTIVQKSLVVCNI